MLSYVRKLSRRIYLPAGWTLITIILLCLPGSAIPTVGIYGLSNIDKLVHFLLFGFIAMSWTMYYSWKYPLFWKRWMILAGLFSIALGIILEFVQLYFIPNRDFDIWDIVADTTGAVVFCIIYFNAERKRAV